MLYIGVTNDLKRRVSEHKDQLGGVFTKKYHITKLVYYEPCENIEGAITREKQLKGLLRARKNELVARQNPYWHDLNDELC